jgi:hypothetical protein
MSGELLCLAKHVALELVIEAIIHFLRRYVRKHRK